MYLGGCSEISCFFLMRGTKDIRREKIDALSGGEERTHVKAFAVTKVFGRTLGVIMGG